MPQFQNALNFLFLRRLRLPWLLPCRTPFVPARRVRRPFFHRLWAPTIRCIYPPNGRRSSRPWTPARRPFYRRVIRYLKHDIRFKRGRKKPKKYRFKKKKIFIRHVRTMYASVFKPEVPKLFTVRHIPEIFYTLAIHNNR